MSGLIGSSPKESVYPEATAIERTLIPLQGRPKSRGPPSPAYVMWHNACFFRWRKPMSSLPDVPPVRTSPHAILVLDGNENQAVTCVRSLGRAGHDVRVGSDTPWSKAGWSRYCRRSFQYPGPQQDA